MVRLAAHPPALLAAARRRGRNWATPATGAAVAQWWTSITRKIAAKPIPADGPAGRGSPIAWPLTAPWWSGLGAACAEWMVAGLPPMGCSNRQHVAGRARASTTPLAFLEPGSRLQPRLFDQTTALRHGPAAADRAMPEPAPAAGAWHAAAPPELGAASSASPARPATTACACMRPLVFDSQRFDQTWRSAVGQR